MIPIFIKVPLLVLSQEGVKLQDIVSEETLSEYSELREVDFNISSIIYFEEYDENPKWSLVQCSGETLIIGLSTINFKGLINLALHNLDGLHKD